MPTKAVLDSSSAETPCYSGNPETWSLSDTVSLIIVNYNACDCIVACVSSALSQVDEVIVVDNASSDDSLAQLELVFSGDRKLKIVRNQENLGFAAGCNIGVDHSAGTFLLFLNPDCVLAPDSVKNLMGVFHDRQDVGMVGGLLLNPNGTEQPGGRRAVPTPWRSFVRVFGLSRFAGRWPRLFFDFHLHEQPLPTHPIEVEAISNTYMLIRHAAMQDVEH